MLETTLGRPKWAAVGFVGFALTKLGQYIHDDIPSLFSKYGRRSA
jgi:hypothetical protein